MGRFVFKPLFNNYKLKHFSPLSLAKGLGAPIFKLLVFGVISLIILTKLLIKLTRSLPNPTLPQITLPNISIKFVTALTLFVLFINTALIISTYIFYSNILKDLPKAELLKNRNVDLTTKIYDRNGELLYSIYKDENRTLVPLEEVPMHVRLATLAAEDSEFYTHKGVSLKGMSRSAYKYLREGKVTGGSTITQQLVKNALLTPEKTVTRKLKEIIIAFAVEQNFTKDEILEMYLNEVSYGGTAFGIEEAAKQYFEKHVHELTLGEAALLAGLPNSPTKLSPFGTSPKEAKKRQNYVLSQMLENNYISEAQLTQANAQELNYANNLIGIKAPHFVMYVKNLLVDKYGEDMVATGGLEVYTTLDLKSQALLDQSINTEIDKIAHLNVTNAAGLILNPKTGEILAMAGSKNYFDTEKDGNVNVTLMPRQPGSSIKVVNYAYALSNGFTPATIIDDSPVTFNIQGQPPYKPKNYDDKFRGQITLRSALAESRNIPAVKILDKVGVKNMLQLGKDMGITTWEDQYRFGLSLTLGGGEVKLIDLAQVYATLANKGQKPTLTSIMEIKDSSKKTIYKNPCTQSLNCETEKVLDQRVAYMVTDILSDNNARSPAFGSNSSLVVRNHPEVAVKTGTSNNLRDNLTLGYSQDYLVAVWVGNNDNSEMSRIASGVTGAAPIWNTVMTELLTEKESVAWQTPEGMTKLSICNRKEEWFLNELKPPQNCPEDNSKIAEKEDESNRPERRENRRRNLN